jgi:predicted DNA-binding transcriptional regulator AlpA
MGPFIKRLDLYKIFPVARETIDRAVRRGEFPAPIRLGRTRFFDASKIDAWLHAQTESAQTEKSQTNGAAE